MGKGEVDTTNKTSKSSPAQEQPPSSPAAVYPDWASVQAYYNTAGTPVPPSGFYPSPVASSPQGHPYMWSPQIMPPYGTAPPPYVTMYPGGGLYPHPSIPPGSHPYSPFPMLPPNGTSDASVAGAGGADLDGKSNGIGKASGASANGGFSQSAESGSEGSSEGSDANSDNGSQQKQCREQGKGDEVQNGSTSGSASGLTQMPTPLMSIPPGAITSPTTTLNIGMDYWGGSSSSPITPIRSKLPVKQSAATDERELKRQRRKQSNRESARRSRLRKQAECEELAQRVGTLKQENDTLKEELDRIREDCKKLASEYASLTERFQGKQEEQSKVDEGPSQPDSNT